MSWPPYELVDALSVARAREKSRRLERLYHLTHEHAWDGKATLAALVEKHGPPGRDMDPEVRESLARLLSLLLWGELAAWTISADLALEIDDVDAKMAATAQVFDEARHFTVLRDYLVMLLTDDSGDAAPPPRLGAVVRRLLLDVMHTKQLAKKLVGMQLLFETNAVVIFKRLTERELCPILTELLPLFERDESRHVGLGVLYLPRLIQKMTPAEARSTATFHRNCLLLLIAGGLTLRPDFERLGMDQRLMTSRVQAMQDDIVQQMVKAHGRSLIGRAVINPKRSKIGPKIVNFVHPPQGLHNAPRWHRELHGGLRRVVGAVDRGFA